MINATASDVAQYMLAELTKDEVLYQETIAYCIQAEFGDDFVYINENGNLAICRPVLDAFRKLTEGKVVWDRSGRFWRPREQHEDPSKRQAE